MTSSTTLTELRRQLVANPRGAGGIAGWTGSYGTGGAGTRVAAVNDPEVLGGTYVRQTWTTAPTAYNGGLAAGVTGSTSSFYVIPVTGGQPLAVAALTRVSRDQRLGLQLFWYNAAGVSLAGPSLTASAEIIPGGTWHRLSAVVTAPADAVRVVPQITGYSGAGASLWAVGDYLDVTAVLVEQASTVGEYFDGGQDDSPPLYYSWGGVPHASQSLLQRIDYRTAPFSTSRGVFTPRSRRVWSIGDPDAPAVSLNGVDGDGVTWVCADPVGWYASPPTELGLTDRATHGSNYGRGAYKARVLTLSGAFRTCTADPDLLDDIAERLQDCLDPMVDTLLSVTERIPKQLTVRPSSEVSVLPVPGHRNARTFSVVLTAGDPFKYAAGAAGLTTVELALLDPSTVRGFTHPMEHPLDHGGAPLEAPDRKNAANPGQLPVDVILRFVGPAVRPVITNASTGEFFALNRELLIGEEVVVDTELRTVLVNGASSTAIRQPRSTFWQLARGVNDLRFTADFYQSTARAYVSYRPRWK